MSALSFQVPRFDELPANHSQRGKGDFYRIVSFESIGADAVRK